MNNNKRSLTTKIAYAVKAGELPTPFTTADVVAWGKEGGVLNDRTGEPYADSSLSAAPSNADKKNEGSSNRNEKFIYSEGPKNKKRYFINPEAITKNVLDEIL